MIRRQHTVSQFFAEATTMRAALDARFKDPQANGIPWNYFCVPRLYTYLKTHPREAIPATLFDRFMGVLRQWSLETLGLVPMGRPMLHLMVDGCKIELHNDFHNGVWGYVYSLTLWENRCFRGGETLLMKDGSASYKRHHVQGESLYELIPAYFNQLLVFDDRIVHGTPAIEGSMDPLEARIALVGHLRASSIRVCGGLSADAASKVVLESMPRLAERIRHHKDVQGMITFRVTLRPAGTVESLVILTDNLVTASSGYEPCEPVAAVRSAIQQTLMGLKFPSGAAPSTLTIPVLVPLPDLRPVIIRVPHGASRESVQEWAVGYLAQSEALGLSGAWQGGESFCVQEPVAGSLRIESNEIVGEFEAPMWVPSQRDRFQTELSKQITLSLAEAGLGAR